MIETAHGGLQDPSHIGTGNYNRSTAQVYPDLGLCTSNPRITADASDVLNMLTGCSRQTSYRELIVAPVALGERLTSLIDWEIDHQRAGRPSGIIIKNNGVGPDGAGLDLFVGLAAGNTKAHCDSLNSGLFYFNTPGSDLLSHGVSPTVPSAVSGLTSVFGMGTGVTLIL